MRLTKAETVAKYRDQFLAGKSEEAIRKFDEKGLEKQYISIANWRRNQPNLSETTKNLVKASVAEVAALVKLANKKLKNLEELSPKDTQKLHNAIDELKGNIHNFEQIKNQRELASLISMKEETQKAAQELDRKIEELKQRIGG